MAALELDPKTALVVIDLQKGIVARLGALASGASVLANGARLAEAFRKAKLPVVLVNVSFAPDRSDALKPRADAAPPIADLPADFAELIPELNVQTHDILITKHQWGAFYGTDLDLQLRRRGVTGIVLCGVATSIGVESTARSAYEHGYQLAFARDAMADFKDVSHANSIENIFPRIGQVRTTDEILAALDRS